MALLADALADDPPSPVVQQPIKIKLTGSTNVTTTTTTTTTPAAAKPSSELSYMALLADALGDPPTYPIAAAETPVAAACRAADEDCEGEYLPAAISGNIPAGVEALTAALGSIKLHTIDAEGDVLMGGCCVFWGLAWSGGGVVDYGAFLWWRQPQLHHLNCPCFSKTHLVLPQIRSGTRRPA